MLDLTLKEVLMRRDYLTEAEAEERIDEAVNLIIDGADPVEVLHDEFGLEPDYIFDLIDRL